LHGKQKWFPLDTEVLSAAKLRLSDKGTFHSSHENPLG
jgi:hypothetical protein